MKWLSVLPALHLPSDFPPQTRLPVFSFDFERFSMLNFDFFAPHPFFVFVTYARHESHSLVLAERMPVTWFLDKSRYRLSREELAK